MRQPLIPFMFAILTFLSVMKYATSLIMVIISGNGIYVLATFFVLWRVALCCVSCVVL
jgi:hypothetical protein